MNIQAIRAAVQDTRYHSFADIRQDVLALAVSDFKINGYFVEFGALDGVKGSNTLMLEREYAWDGILSEPARRWRKSILQNRCSILEERAVAAQTGLKLEFKETETHLGLSGLVDFFNASDMHALTRSTSAGASYTVETVSLNDMLNEHAAPDYIDYISVDTEGSELSILEAFDFTRRVGLWTIEHNFINDIRIQIHEIMSRNGYIRILEDLSQIDDWYVLTQKI